MKFTKIVALMLVVGALLFATACGDDANGRAATSQTASASKPEGFPADVPVVGSLYKPYDSPFDDAVGMEVVGANEALFDEAVAKLRDAKFDEAVSPGPPGVERNATYSNAKYTVVVVSTESDGKLQLTYNVIVADREMS